MRRWRPVQHLPLSYTIKPQSHPRPGHGDPHCLRRRVQPPPRRMLQRATGELHGFLSRSLHRPVDGLRRGDCGGGRNWPAAQRVPANSTVRDNPAARPRSDSQPRGGGGLLVPSFSTTAYGASTSTSTSEAAAGASTSTSDAAGAFTSTSTSDAADATNPDGDRIHSQQHTIGAGLLRQRPARSWYCHLGKMRWASHVQYDGHTRHGACCGRL